jgi:hypothetical protein
MLPIVLLTGGAGLIPDDEVACTKGDWNARSNPAAGVLGNEACDRERGGRGDTADQHRLPRVPPLGSSGEAPLNVAKDQQGEQVTGVGRAPALPALDAFRGQLRKGAKPLRVI